MIGRENKRGPHERLTASLRRAVQDKTSVNPHARAKSRVGVRPVSMKWQSMLEFRKGGLGIRGEKKTYALKWPEIVQFLKVYPNRTEVMNKLRSKKLFHLIRQIQVMKPHFIPNQATIEGSRLHSYKTEIAGTHYSVLTKNEYEKLKNELVQKYKSEFRQIPSKKELKRLFFENERVRRTDDFLTVLSKSRTILLGRPVETTIQSLDNEIRQYLLETKKI